MNKKIISRTGVPGFTNNPTPGANDAFLFEDATTGEYYNVTKDQLTAIFGGGNSTTEQDVLATVLMGVSVFNLANTPIAGTLKAYLNGQRCGVGVGFLVTHTSGSAVYFDDDYTGQNVIFDYEY